MYRYAFFAFLLLVTTGSADAGVRAESFAPLVEKLSPAVVNISSSQKLKSGGMTGAPFGNMPLDQQEQLKEFFQQFGIPQGGMGGGKALEQEVQSLGSGFVISADGYIVTNNHVVEKAEQISVRFQDNTKYEAKLVGRDPKTDLALLKIESKKSLAFVALGDSDKVKVGDWVITIGNPYGLGGTVTAGIVSARGRNINAGPFDDFLQTDAAINQGNSGGPMFNTDGEVIGVNTAIFSPNGGSVGIGFAIPSSMAKPVIEQLRTEGRTHRGWLGVKIQQVTDEIANSLGRKNAKGALVLEVTPDSPAAKAGIKAGDVIISFDGKDIGEMHQLPRIVAETKIGKEVEVEVWCGNDTEEFDVTLGELDESEDLETSASDTAPKSEKKLAGEAMLDLEVQTISDGLRARYGIPKDIKGVVIVQVKRDGEAAMRGVQPGDVILAVNQRDVKDISALKSAVAEARDAGRDYILMRVWRAGESTYITLPTGKDAKKK